MKRNNTILLLGTMLKSTSGLNALKYCKDYKKKRKIIGNYIAYGIVLVMFVVLAALQAYGTATLGLASTIPQLSALTVSSMAFLLILLRANGYLFGFKEFDMLMSMPFEAKTVVGCKFWYMYFKTLPWMLSISVAMMIGYGIVEKPVFYIYLLWVLLSLVLPVIPAVAASAVGYLVVRIGTRFKYKKVIQAILTFLFIGFCLFGRFFIEAVLRNGQGVETLTNLTQTADQIGSYYLPVIWFGKAIIDRKLYAIMALVGTSILVYELFIRIVSRSYLKVNSGLTTSTAKKNYKMTRQKKRSVVQAIAFKEFRRMLGCNVYLTNACFGHVITIILGAVALFVKGETLLALITHDAPIPGEVILPSIPFIIFFLVGMVPTTCCTPSLEGKNYWIIQSMPISRKDLYKGKMLFNMYLSLPVMIFGTVALGFSFRAGLDYILLYVLVSLALCLYSTAFGMITGTRFIKLDWENEVEVVKQGAAVAVYLLPNMFLTMLVAAGAIFLGFFMDGRILLLIIAAVYGVLGGLFCIPLLKEKKTKN